MFQRAVYFLLTCRNQHFRRVTKKPLELINSVKFRDIKLKSHKPSNFLDNGISLLPCKFLEERTAFYPTPLLPSAQALLWTSSRTTGWVNECCMTGEGDNQKKENQCLGDKGLERCIFEKSKGSGETSWLKAPTLRLLVTLSQLLGSHRGLWCLSLLASYNPGVVSPFILDLLTRETGARLGRMAAGGANLEDFSIHRTPVS